MTLALLLAALLFLSSLALHLGMIRWAKRIAPLDQAYSLTRTLAGQLVVLLSHLLVAGLFAVGFALAVSIGLGGFEKEASMTSMDYYYFSLINVTTVGLGDIYPTGHLRVIAGVESLTGFLLISCSAQYVYKMMSKQET